MASPIYMQLADDLASLVKSGQLKPGDRLPSVRRLVKHSQVSATTAMAALRLLETRGLAEARPQSGYFAKAHRVDAGEPEMSRPPSQPRAVGIDNLMIQVIDASRNPDMAPFGAATPGVELFPVRRLQRLAAATVRRDARLIGEYGLEYVGRDSLRHQLLRRYADMGCRIDPEELIITNGCTEAMNLALRTVTRPGDTVAIESPAYYCMLQVLQDLGLKALEIPTHPRDGMDLDALEQALQERRVGACLVSANFSNPTGACMSDAAKHRLVGLCVRQRVPLIEDDIYGDLQHSGPRPLPAKAFDTAGNVILCSSFSKTLAPGGRIGWLCGGRYSDELRRRKFASSGATAALMQEVIAEFLRSGAYQRHLARIRSSYAGHVSSVAEAVSRHFPSGTKLTQPQGGFVIWVELPGGLDSLALFEVAARRGVNFAPGPLFSATGRYRNFLRLNCGRRWTPLLETSLARLGKWAELQLRDG